MNKRVLIIGGTGVFGKRLVRHLAASFDVEIFVSSRSLDKAEAFIETLSRSTARVNAVKLECQENLKDVLHKIAPFVVIDCSGPFQTASYATARQIIRSGAHLIDLADARDYLANFADSLDDLARQNGVTALTGASSTPTLSTCVVGHLVSDWQRVDSIDICITPGGRSEVGRSVIEAILSYAGRPVPIWHTGKLSKTTGWVGARKVDMPGLGHRRIAPVETFDAEYLGQRFEVKSRVSFAAGLESRVEQFGIEALAKLRKWGLFGQLTSLIPLLLGARQITRFPTSDEGGMLVEMHGLDANGVQAHAKWSLIAKQDHGPFIPILPAAAAVESLLQEGGKPGAFFAHEVLELSKIVDQMQGYDISILQSVEHAELGFIERALGSESYNALPSAVRDFHDATGSAIWSGSAEIASGKGLFAKLLARLFGFPHSGQNVPVTVLVERHSDATDGPSERWTRIFAQKMMWSDLSAVGSDVIAETFVPFTFELALCMDQNRLSMRIIRWRLGWFVLPNLFMPKSEAFEYMNSAGQFCFDVKLTVPGVGLLSHYQGWLEPKPGLT